MWWLSSRRRSAARRSTLDEAKELLHGVDDDVGACGVQTFPREDAAPRNADGEDAGRPCGLDVERRVADVRRVLRVGVQPLECEQERLWIRLQSLRLVSRHYGLEHGVQREHGEGKVHRRSAL